MKKIFILIIILFVVCGCSFSQKQIIKINNYKQVNNTRYLSFINYDSIREADSIAKVDSIMKVNEKWQSQNKDLDIRESERPKTYPLPIEKEIQLSKQVTIPVKKIEIYETNKIVKSKNNNQNNDQLDELYKTGQITYTLNDTMIVGRTTEVNFTISSNVDLKKIISEIETFNEENLNIDTILVSENMRARLIDPSGDINFKIVRMTEEEQFLNEGEYTLWKWNVTPLNKGNNKLSISVDVIVNNKSKSIKVYDGTIYVYSDETILHKIWSFIIQYLEFIVGTILIPIIIFIYTTIKNKKRKD